MDMFVPYNIKDYVSIETVYEPKNMRGYLVIKRFLDIFLSCIGLFLSFPFIILFAILIRMESEGSCFYSQIRVGKDGKLFKIYKLRSMYADAEKEGPQWVKRNDPRITKVGRFIRRTRIDEIPQLINILKGDMSIVGPRRRDLISSMSSSRKSRNTT